MQIDFSEGCISILAPAKLNLFLEVLGKRADGYHEIETVMCPISLCDHIRVSPTDTADIVLEVLVPAARAVDAAWAIPNDQQNLVVRAAEAVRRELGISAGCHIRLEKRIPAAAGLGGGSSDAAATVVACLGVWSTWNRQLATSVCAELGSDIPFFLGDSSRIGMALATGRGEHCELLEARPPLEFLVTHPPAGCSTAEVYKAHSTCNTPRTAEKIISACETGQFDLVGTELFNALQLPASRLNPWIGRQLDLFRVEGLEYSLMTGSGSSCFAIASKPDVDLNKFSVQARTIGVERIYEAKAWYAESIECQLALEERLGRT